MYETSSNYKSKIYKVKHLLRIYINGVEVEQSVETMGDK